ncbi:hypothetical protein ACLJJ6_00150 [Pediococcus siamensis]|uniref:hypothetical protein n=1 Tax=Pediococcus siamensis TaxID=381829 RepID=UPI0039A2D131
MRKFNLQLAILVLLGFAGFYFSHPVTADTTAKPFPENEILGVGSYFNAFAAGTMTIDANNTANLEGRYAANNLESSTNSWNTRTDSTQWGQITSDASGRAVGTPLFTANKVDSDTTYGTYMRHMLDPNARQRNMMVAPVVSDKNQIVINNLRAEAKVFTDADKLNHASLLDILDMDKNVGDTSDFSGDNGTTLARVSGLTLDPDKTDASNYFDAAATQFEKISQYYDQFTQPDSDDAKDQDKVVVNDQVNDVKVTQTTPEYQNYTNLTIDVTLPKDYSSTKNYENPPVIMVGVNADDAQDKNLNLTIKIRNMDTTTNSVQAGTSSYDSYAYPPYIFINWDNVTTKSPFSNWQGSFKMQAYTGTDTDESPANSDNGTEQSQLFSSHVLNNFPNATTSGSDTLEFGNTAEDSQLCGAMLLPNASVSLSAGSRTLYGSILSGKNVTIAHTMPASRLIAGTFDINDISGSVFDSLHSVNPYLKNLSLVTSNTLTDKSVTPGETGTTANNKTIQVTDPTKSVGLQGTVVTRNKNYQLFYRFNQSDWHKLNASGVNTEDSSTFKFNNLISLPGYNKKLTAKNIQSEAATDTPTLETVGTDLQRQNTIEVVLTPKTDDDGNAITADSDLSSYEHTTINLTETGKLTANIPNTFQLTAETDDPSVYSSPDVKNIQIKNDWRVPYSLSVQYNKTAAANFDLDGLTLFDQPQLVSYAKDGSAFDISQPLLQQTTGNTLTASASATFQLKLNVANLLSSGRVQTGKKYGYPLYWTLKYDLNS